jgi:hypothetical protein
MQDYRAYILGPEGHVQNRVDRLCDDEAEAIRLAKQLVDGHAMATGSQDRDVQARGRAALLSDTVQTPTSFLIYF